MSLTTLLQGAASVLFNNQGTSREALHECVHASKHNEGSLKGLNTGLKELRVPVGQGSAQHKQPFRFVIISLPRSCHLTTLLQGARSVLFNNQGTSREALHEYVHASTMKAP
jgi:hypothetical protein